MWVVYLVRCLDNTLYCGVTNDLDLKAISRNKCTDIGLCHFAMLTLFRPEFFDK
jgi:hypothetical protein